MPDEVAQGMVIWWCIFVVWAIATFFLFRRLGRWRLRLPDYPVNYRVTNGALSITAFGGLVTLVRIPKAGITAAQVVSPLHWRLFNPLVLSLRSHMLRKVVIIKTTGRLPYAISPADPESFVAELGL